MKFEDFVTASRYVDFGSYYESHATTIGRRKLYVSIRGSIALYARIPKRFPRKVIADVVSMMGYQDRTTGLTLHPSSVEIKYPLYRKSVVEVYVSGKILNSCGRYVGEIERTFVYSRGGKAKYVIHDNLRLTRGNQGNGFARRYLNWAKRTYALHGFNHIETYAAAGGRSYNGSYTWARLGFTPIQKVTYNSVVVKHVLEQANDAVMRGELSPQLVKKAERLIKSRDGSDLVRLSRLGVSSKYRTKKGHLGKELILAAANGWDGKIPLNKAG